MINLSGNYNNNQVLLTIAIPTFNRAKVLDIALNRLLPQLEKHSDHIEFVISDNASTDNTQEIIERYFSVYHNIKVKTNIQPYNTGLFGNFKKCRELSTGKYFWLLSDNDHISPGVIDFLIDQLASGNDAGAYYFSNNSLENKYSIERSDVDTFFLSEKAFFLTLITSVVMLNDKAHDSLVIEKYPENSFLGFLLLCNALISNKNIAIIKGKTFKEYRGHPSFDIFKSWTKDINECINYMIINNIINNKTKETFITGFLKKNVTYFVFIYLMKRKYYEVKHYTPNELKVLLDKYYSDYNIYKSNIIPLFNRSRLSLYCEFIFKKISRKAFKIRVFRIFCVNA